MTAIWQYRIGVSVIYSAVTHNMEFLIFFAVKATR
jgi:energy-converting hydrogenase Eha subunit E